MRAIISLSLASVLSLTGCTRDLWRTNDLDTHYRPATEPDLRVGYAPREHDFLVVYRESCDGHKKTQPRAFWLNENMIRVEDRHAPIFVSPKRITTLEPVPVLCQNDRQSTNAPAPFAVLSNDKLSFTLHPANDPPDVYPLPIYATHNYTARILLTPLALAGDIVALGFTAWLDNLGHDSDDSVACSVGGGGHSGGLHAEKIK
jgi:hypothetical protein